MTAIINLFNQHPFWATAILTWVSNYGVSAFVNSLPAPTAQSKPLYVFFFRFATALLAQNPTRAVSTKVEASPNFQDAVNNLPGPVDKPVVIVEAPKP